VPEMRSVSSSKYGKPLHQAQLLLTTSQNFFSELQSIQGILRAISFHIEC